MALPFAKGVPTAAMTATGASVTRYTNCKVVCNGDVLPGDVWVREGKIINPTDLFYGLKKLPDTVVDCRGLIVSPGFVDIQINGEGGLSTTNRALRRISPLPRCIWSGLLLAT